jgi:hypothetical protein
MVMEKKGKIYPARTEKQNALARNKPGRVAKEALNECDRCYY